MKINFKLVDRKRKQIYIDFKIKPYKTQKSFSIACWIPYGSYMDYLQKWTQPRRKEIKNILERIIRTLNKSIQEEIKKKKEELIFLKEFEEKDFIIK